MISKNIKKNKVLIYDIIIGKLLYSYLVVWGVCIMEWCNEAIFKNKFKILFLDN